MTFTLIDYTPPTGTIAVGCAGKDYSVVIETLQQRGLVFYPTAYASPQSRPVIMVFSGGSSGSSAQLTDAHVKGNLVNATGFPPSGDIGTGHSSLALWNNGYIVIAHQGRGRGSVVPGESWTNGGLSEGIDEFGRADLEDYVQAENLRFEFLSAHPTKTCYIGSSRGGMELALVLAKKGKAPDAVILKSAMLDLDDWRVVQNGRLSIPDFEAPSETDFNNLSMSDRDSLHTRTAARFTDMMSAQIEYLIIHGDADPTVPLSQARKVVRRLRLFGANVQFEIIQGGTHGLRNTPAIAQRVAALEQVFLARTIG